MVSTPFPVNRPLLLRTTPAIRLSSAAEAAHRSRFPRRGSMAALATVACLNRHSFYTRPACIPSPHPLLRESVICVNSKEHSRWRQWPGGCRYLAPAGSSRESMCRPTRASFKAPRPSSPAPCEPQRCARNCSATQLRCIS